MTPVGYQAFTSIVTKKDTIFIGELSLGIFRSVDAGQTWEAVNNGLGRESGVIGSFLAKGSIVFSGSERGVFRSPDSGKTWVPTGSEIVGVLPGRTGLREYGIHGIPGGIFAEWPKDFF